MPATPLPGKDLPIAKYRIRHRHGEETRIRPCVHLITYGLDYGKPDVLNFKTVLELDLSTFEAPPAELCDRLTGQDPDLVKSFFSIPKNEKAFKDALAALRYEMREESKLQPPGRCIAFKINCVIGRHRSVAMAESLARAVASLDRAKAECLHLDLEKGSKIPSKNAVRKYFTPSRRTAQAMPETQGGHRRPKGAAAAATADAVHNRREEPLQKKMMSWETRPSKQSGNQEHENGRSPRPWGEEGTNWRLF